MLSAYAYTTVELASIPCLFYFHSLSLSLFLSDELCEWGNNIKKLSSLDITRYDWNAFNAITSTYTHPECASPKANLDRV